MVVGEIPTGVDVAVVGGGPGGYSAAIRAAQLDLDVVLVEEDALGGTCLNHGCIPSKALISATDLAHRAANSEEMGVYSDVTIKVGEMFGWKDDIVENMRGGVEKLCKANDVSVVEGRAAFEDSRTLRIEGEEAESVEFDAAVVSTGSRPVELDGFSYGDDEVLSSREALMLEDYPESLVVVGGGYIGMELSGVFAKLDSDVTVVEALDYVLPEYEYDVARPVKKKAEEYGVDFHFGERAIEWRETEEGIEVETEGEGGGATYECDRVLVAVGREPVLPDGLDAAGVELGDDDYVRTDDRARTAADGIYAVGDVAGPPLLAHKAYREGVVAAEVIAGEPAALDYRAVPSVVYTEPEIGVVGLTEEEAREDGYEPVVGTYRLGSSGRALTMGRTEGFVRVVADGDAGFVLGGQVVGAGASELIAEFGLAIEMGATLEDVSATIHAHPTLSEGVKEAADNALGRAIHTLNR